MVPYSITDSTFLQKSETFHDLSKNTFLSFLNNERLNTVVHTLGWNDTTAVVCSITSSHTAELYNTSASIAMQFLGYYQQSLLFHIRLRKMQYPLIP